MAIRNFTTAVGMKNYIDSKCTIAVENTAKRLQEKLVEIIDRDYYDQYDPLYYKPRTYAFLKSAVSKMLNSHTASIGIDDTYFDYEYPSRYMMFENGGGTGRNVSGHWTGEDQVYMASQGYHGTYNIRTEGRFWDDFVDWANENAIKILREELISQGLTPKNKQHRITD